MALHKTAENKYTEIYRARVVEVDVDDDGEKNKYGAVRVFLPDLMNKEIDTEVDEFKDGILAYPGNLLMGGYNEDDPDKSSYYCAAGVYVPLLNSYVKVMFEGGDLERAFYIGPWHDKIAPLPPVNRNVDEPHKVYTVITTNSGRSMVICDSEDQARVEITGKKRKLNPSDGPAGNKDSAYEIDDNQTTILLDERQGNEKLLIKTHKGDYVKLDIEKQSLECYFKGDIIINTDSNFILNAKKNIDIKAEQSCNIESKSSMNIKSSNSTIFIDGKSALGIKSNGKILIKGSATFIQTPLSCPAKAAAEANPTGDR